MDIVALIQRLKRKEELAYKELVFAFSSRLMTVARIYNNSNDDAKDVLQDAFVLVYKKIENFEGEHEAALFAWIKKLIINISLSRNQRMYRRMEGSLDDKHYNLGIDAKGLSALAHEEIMKLVFSLPDGYRQVFAMYAIEGYSHKEIANSLNIKESSSRSQYMRSRKMLQKQISNLTKVMTA